ncbi:MAG: LysM peptidoglycan-binding domain-containing protein [Bacteroidales bacterium]|nr:LysM peptidoglycan-binding domain-containing protein [Bacteroidales bacterium]
MISKRTLILFFTITLYSGMGIFAQEDSIPIPDSVQSFIGLQKPKGIYNQELLKDSPIIQMIDSLAGIKFFQDNYFEEASIAPTYRMPMDAIPVFADSVYEARLKRLDAQTPIYLMYNNHVRDFIDLYAVRKRALTIRVLGLSHIYFPLFEEMLDKYNLPLELKYLAVVESALNPTAGSRMGAKGLWQFMYGTGKVYGLGVNSVVDDRFDPYMATDAACRHLRDLYDIYGDWSLVLAAYNSGAGNVNKAIRRAGGVKNYWAIWPFLPRETRGYVPAFIAVTYVMSYAPEHNLYPLHPGILYSGIDTVQVKEVLSLEQINEMLGIPLEDLKFLNPAFKLGIIPASKEKKYSLRLPRESIGDFVNNETALYNYKTQKGLEREIILKRISKVKDQTVHIVKRGETLGGIANKYRVSVNDIKKWNNLKKNSLRIKQKLVIFPGGNAPDSKDEPKETIAKTEKTKNGNPSSKSESSTKYYSVESGDNLNQIAKNFNCSIDDLKKWNNLDSDVINIRQKLLVQAPENEKSSAEPQKSKLKYYTVKDGDTLWEIAQHYEGVTVEQIKEWNNIRRPSQLRVGQKLKVYDSN